MICGRRDQRVVLGESHHICVQTSWNRRPMDGVPDDARASPPLGLRVERRLHRS